MKRTVRVEGSYLVSPGVYNWLLSVSCNGREQHCFGFKGTRAELAHKCLEIEGVL